MAKSTTTVVGARTVRQNLIMAGGRWKRAVSAGLYLEANNIMALSKREVPVDLGGLKGSGYVTLPQDVGGKILVEMGYGGPAKDYAVVQHERLDFNHPEGGKAKYLEDPVDARQPNIARNVWRLAKAAFAQGVGPVQGKMPTGPGGGDSP